VLTRRPLHVGGEACSTVSPRWRFGTRKECLKLCEDSPYSHGDIRVVGGGERSKRRRAPYVSVRERKSFTGIQGFADTSESLQMILTLEGEIT
jgi:hypothetical protein